MKANVVNLDKIFGGGYNDFWRSKKRYVKNPRPPH